MCVSGIGGSKKLQDIFTDARIPSEVRAHVPIIVDAADRILAVVGLREANCVLRPSDFAGEGSGMVAREFEALVLRSARIQRML